MTSNRLVTCCIALVTTALLASTAQAGLVVTVTRDSAPGRTLWTFSGSSTYSQIAAGGKFAAAGTSPTLIEEWKGGGTGSDYVVTGEYNNFTTTLVSGAIGLTVSTPGNLYVGSIGYLHIDHDDSGDDFGVGLFGDDIPLLGGDVVAWSGSAVFDVDINKLNPGAFSFSNYGGSQAVAGQIYGTLPLTLNVSVPEVDPASLSAVLGLVIGVLAIRERRRTIGG